MYAFDDFGADLYRYFCFYRALAAFQDSYQNITGLTLSYLKEPGLVVFKEFKEFTNSEIPRSPVSKSKMSSGERAALSICASCFFGGSPKHAIRVFDFPIHFLQDASFRYVLLDEPENSLHVAWQERLLESLHSQIESRPAQIIVATHSPSLISDKADWLIEVLDD